ncbi:MAG: hypothetical protein SFY80_13680 [Verrucomicrobiota bacterium]|nr:hypothetical protein [Verrucomicrobiota bacterium]
MSQLLELTASEDRDGIFQAYQNGGFHYLGIYGDANGSWAAFGIGPKEDCRTLEEMQRNAPRTTIVNFYVACPQCPTPGKLASAEAFSYFTRWAKELAEKERTQSGGPVDFTLISERAALDIKEKKLKELERRIEDREKDFEVYKNTVEERVSKFSEVEASLKAREQAIADKEDEVMFLESRLVKLRDEEKNIERGMKKLRDMEADLKEREKGLNERENFISESETRLMELTMEQQEREARLEQLHDDIKSKSNRMKATAAE